MKRKLVVISGAGVSAESGVRTFRDAGGLWEGHAMEAVATPEAWSKDPELVLEFYNQRRRQLLEVQHNMAHSALAQMENDFDVTVITQNVDDLHERSGSSRVLHLHGELRKVRSTADINLIYPWDKDLQLGDKCELGSQLRPHIVWFGEPVPMIELAAMYISQADTLIIVGTSLLVYPAAGLIHYAPSGIPVYYIDPKPADLSGFSIRNLHVLAHPATIGVPMAVEMIMSERS